MTARDVIQKIHREPSLLSEMERMVRGRPLQNVLLSQSGWNYLKSTTFLTAVKFFHYDVFLLLMLVRVAKPVTSLFDKVKLIFCHFTITFCSYLQIMIFYSLLSRSWLIYSRFSQKAAV